MPCRAVDTKLHYITFLKTVIYTCLMQGTYCVVGLAHLCEFIEDCEHTSLAVRILHLLGKEGPRTKQPSR
jgi:hypothetical protein